MMTCIYCRKSFEPPKPDVTYCRECYYSGEHHAQRMAPMLAALHAEHVNTYVEHTGGGCFWIAARRDDARVVAFTMAFQDEGGAWEGDAMLPDAPEGPWYGVHYADESGQDVITERIPMTMAECAAFLRESFAMSAAEAAEAQAAQTAREAVRVFNAAREKFITAAQDLDETWQRLDRHVSDHGARDYPSYLPSFDEFVGDLLAWRDGPDEVNSYDAEARAVYTCPTCGTTTGQHDASCENAPEVR